jgi:hypothetical protein
VDLSSYAPFLYSVPHWLNKKIAQFQVTLDKGILEAYGPQPPWDTVHSFDVGVEICPCAEFKHHVMRTYRRVEMKPHTFLTLVLDGVK